MRHAFALLILIAGMSFLPPYARAQWQVDGVRVCTGCGAPAIVSDDTGGAIVAWGSAQRMSSVGIPQWTPNGVALGGRNYPAIIVSDGAGGAIVPWSDYRNGSTPDIYAQRVNAAGAPQWTVNGVALCTAAGDQFARGIVTDGAGGAIVAWEDSRSGAYPSIDIYAQRVNAAGVPQWTANGVALCTAASLQEEPEIVADGAGGAIVTWHDFRNGNPDIYAQRVNTLGVTQWTANGVALCTAAGQQYDPAIVSDGTGGAIVTWWDIRSGDADIYAQRVSALGVPQWTANGVALCIAAGSQQEPKLDSDGAGGAIVTWWDFRNDVADIYAQRVDDSGTPQWMADGVALCTAANEQSIPTIVADGAGGAIVTWHDYRNADADIYAQRVSALGVPEWTTDGVAVCTAASYQQEETIVADGAGGAIVTWEDGRSGTNTDIYAQHVTGPSNAVAISSFDASETDGVVTLRSAFRSDLGVEAVNVYRAAGADAEPLIVLERMDNVRSDRFEYVDRDVAPGQNYRYRIGVVDADGEFFSPIVTISVKAIRVVLSQNQPNPFNPTTTIHFVLPVREDVTLAIYDTNGHLVRMLVNNVEDFGAHDVTWDGRDDNGATMGSGMYFYRLRAGKLTESKKMVLLK